MIDPFDVRELEAYFGPAGGGGRSTFGPTLDRQALRYQTSDGQVVDVRRIRVVRRELSGSTEENPRYAEILTPWPWMPVRREQAQGGVEPEDQDEALQLAARVSRRLRQLTPQVRAVLELLYGDEGCRWEGEKEFGRKWALSPLFPVAKRKLRRDTEDRREKGQPESPLRPAERLAMLARKDLRAPWFDALCRLAEREQAEAEAFYRTTATHGQGER